MLIRLFLLSLLLSVPAVFCQEPELAPGVVRIVSEKKASGADSLEWVHTFACRADGSVPSLRVTLGRVGTSASAGVMMSVGPDGLARSSVTVRLETTDREAGAVTVTVEIRGDEKAMAGQVVRLPAGQDLATWANLEPLPAEAQVRRAIGVGNVGGCMMTTYIMPGRSAPRTPITAGPPQGDPAAQVVNVFRTWARAVKEGALEAFSTVVPPHEWTGMDTAQRTRRLQEYQEAFKTVLGEDYDPDAFKLEYTPYPGVGSGKLKIRYGDKELPDLGVRYSGGRWLLVDP